VTSVRTIDSALRSASVGVANGESSSGLEAERAPMIDSDRSCRKLRIVFDMTFPNRLQTGTRVYANELVKALQGNPLNEVTCLAESAPKRSRTMWRKLWNGLHNIFWIQVVLPVQLARLKADVLHSPSFFAPLVCPCPVILTVYDTLYLTQAQHYGDRLYLFYAKLFIKPSVRRSALISTISSASKKDIVSVFNVPETKVKVAYPGVSPRFHPIRDDAELSRIRSKYGLQSHFFLFVGAAEPRKNLARLFRAFSLFQEARSGERYQLVLVGPEGSASTELQDLARQLELLSDVKRLGYVPDDDMPSLYSAATALVFPSLGEGFGLPIVEAMACGTPVVTSSVSCMPEIAGDAALLVDPENVEALAAALDSLASNSLVRQQLAEKGLERVQLFSWLRTAKETEQLYQQVYATRHSGVVS
jgi:glycosyltransferase involved in cell wall biosynthesis